MSDTPELSGRTAATTVGAPEGATTPGGPLANAARWWPGWRDVGCLVFLVTATLHLVMSDGGRPFRPMLPVLVLGVVVIVAAYPTLAGTSRWLRLLAVAWALGPLIAFAFADVRAGWVRPVAAWAIAVPAALATLHVLRRRWGPAAVAGIVGAAVALAWFNGFTIWYGGGTARGEPAWMALSWHNQSGTLMAVLGVGGLGVALATIGWPRVLGVLAGAAGLSATWLSGSRGAVLTASAAVIVTLLIAIRRPQPDVDPPSEHDRDLPAARRELEVPQLPRPATTGIVTLTVAALTIALTLGFAAIWSGSTATPDDDAGGITAQPVTARAEDAAGNLRARFGHWEAAVRMFAQSPLTGSGPGSYAWSSRPVYPEGTNLTASAHGEQVEALGELGIVGGGAALAVSFGLAWLVIVAIGRPGRHHLEVAAAGVATLLVSHAALDFDWDYPVLLALLAITGAALVVARRAPDDPDPGPHPSTYEDEAPSATAPGPRPADRALTVTAAVAAVALIAAGTTGIVLNLRGTSPWVLDTRIAAAVTAAAEGDRQAVTQHLDAMETWNPGAPRLHEVRELAAHGLGDSSDEGLAAVMIPERSAFADQLRAAEQLLVADRPDLALQIVEDVRPVIDRRRAWGVASRVVHATEIELAARDLLGGCDEVEPALAEIRRWFEDHDLDPEATLGLGEEAGWVQEDDPRGWAQCDLTTLRNLSSRLRHLGVRRCV